MVLRPLAALLVVAAAAGCSNSAEKPSTVPQTSRPGPSRVAASTTTTSTPATTAPPAGNTSAGPVEELRAKLIAQGICEKLTTFTALLPITVTGLENCEDGYLLITLPTQFERDAVLLSAADQPCSNTNFFAVSDTWIVIPDPPIASLADRVAGILGGEVRAIDCKRA